MSYGLVGLLLTHTTQKLWMLPSMRSSTPRTKPTVFSTSPNPMTNQSSLVHKFSATAPPATKQQAKAVSNRFMGPPGSGNQRTSIIRTTPSSRGLTSLSSASYTAGRSEPRGVRPAATSWPMSPKSANSRCSERWIQSVCHRHGNYERVLAGWRCILCLVLPLFVFKPRDDGFDAWRGAKGLKASQFFGFAAGPSLLLDCLAQCVVLCGASEVSLPTLSKKLDSL